MDTELRVRQPGWLPAFLQGRPLPADDAQRVAEVLALAAENVGRRSGGPFAAAVYDEDTGERVSCAVNVVVPEHCALAHAETLALALAQQLRGSHTLSARRCVLVASAEPCAMCVGAIAWSGVARVLYAAARTDVEAIGFDEGPRPVRWKAELARRGIRVEGPRQRGKARAVLAAYAGTAGLIYNG